ncbi:succinate dehydrogenase [Tessaracoccus sp. MC1756]|nr:succinate dehydrogenase [Tessaracoccus sp. MC1756]MBB1509408.1 succinate dehydrogenase [Tessaracoccus sp. MC1756]
MRKRPSTFALKQVMAVTGVVFVGFVFIHMIGNLKVYGGPASLDGYATWLREVGYPLIPKKGVLWALRVTLAVSLVVHVWAAVTLWLRGRAARGSHRRRSMPRATAWGARTMLPGGVVILVFVVVHLLDLTIGALVAPGSYAHAGPDGVIPAYANLVASFSRPWMAAFYTFTMVVIGAHIWHGWRALLQDWGVTGRRFRAAWAAVGAVLALAVVAGNAAIPVLVLAGVIA